MIPEAQEIVGLKTEHSRGDGFADAKLYSLEGQDGVWRWVTDSHAATMGAPTLRAHLGGEWELKLHWFTASDVFNEAAEFTGYRLRPRPEQPPAEGEAEAALASVNAEPEPTEKEL